MRAVALAVLLTLTGGAAADDAGWIRVTAQGKTLLFRPDGTGRTESGPVPAGRRQPSPDGKRILYVKADEGKEGVYVAAADGTGARKLSPDNVTATFPEWSPDGKRIAFAGLRGDRWQVHVMDADGSNVRQLTDGPHGAYMPKFGPDGRLAYLVWRQPLGKHRPADLVIADGKDTKAVVKDVYVTDYAWSPDGKAIAYGKPGVLAFHDLTAGREREVVLADINRELSSHAAVVLCWRPDGRAVVCRIMFLGGRRAGGPKMFGDDKLFVVPRDGRVSWFEPGVEVEQIEWVREKGPGHRGPAAP
jgi:dipeptidyl aminopeptidase/acylaminoacyl peptidase